MSVDDENFDIDIYGDAEKEEAEPQASNNNQHQSRTSSTPASLAGSKRKAEDDGYNGDDQHDNDTPSQVPSDQQTQRQPRDPHATTALKATELHWWITEEDLRSFCKRAGVEKELIDLSFGEHKINGKSRGEAYLEFSCAYAADAVKREVEKKDNPGGKKPSDEKDTAEEKKDSSGEKKDPSGEKRLNSFTIFFTSANNPFKGRDSGASGKKESGAYSSFGANRGGGDFRGRGGFDRGRGGFRGDRGGGFGRGGGYQQNNNMANQGGYGGNFNNPMGGMGNMNPMGMMAGMMNGMIPGMGRGGMMGGGRGGFGPGMGGMGGMQGMGGMGGMMPAMARGGMMNNMNQRGGFAGGGGFGQQGGGYGGNAAGGYGTGATQNKRPRTDGQ